jgi:hypothetical protein
MRANKLARSFCQALGLNVLGSRLQVAHDEKKRIKLITTVIASIETDPSHPLLSAQRS